MTSSNYTDYLYFYKFQEEVQILWLFVILATVSIFFIFSLVLFPSYVYVNKINKRRDEMMPIFPITNHFFRMVKLQFLMIFGLVVSWFSFNIFADLDFSFISLSFVLLSCLIFATLNSCTQVFHFLNSILAIQKFLLYFVPSVEPYMTFSGKNLHSFFWIIHSIFGIKDGLSFIAFLATLMDRNSNFQIFFDRYFTFYIILNVFLIISSLLYIPIMIDIRKFSNLPMAKINKPQKYIFLQTMIILVFKIITFPLLLLTVLHRNIEFVVLLLMITTDIIITPLMIEISYLCCNRRNLNGIFGIFQFKKFVKVIFGKSTTGRVGPLPSKTFTIARNGI